MENKGKGLWDKRKAGRLLAGLLLALSLLAGCATPQQNPYLYTGAGLGAALGAGIGAAANHRNPWKGAAIGALLGGAGGGVAGEVYGRSRSNYPPDYYGAPQQPGYSYYTTPPSQGYY